MQTVTDLGQIGAVGGALTPLDLTLTRNGGTWDLSAYTGVRLEAWEHRTKTNIATPAGAALQDAANGVVRLTPNAAFYATSGTYEGRIWADNGTTEEPSGLFRWTIGAGANPT